MAHLIKLADYVSRYQGEFNQYVNQFTRKKKEHWYYIKTEWEQSQWRKPDQMVMEESSPINHKKLNPFMKKLKKLTHFIQQQTTTDLDPKEASENQLQRKREEFLDLMFESQMTWASSSLGERSNLDSFYFGDKHLKSFCTRIPDNFFLLYHPTFFVKNAEVEMEVIVISPSEIYCVTILEGENLSVFEASSERFWIEYIHQKQQKRLSPLLSLSRMSNVIQYILKKEQLSFPIRKVVLSPESMIDNKLQGSTVEFVDKRNYKQWMDKLTKTSSPIKRTQCDLALILLSYCQTKIVENGDEVEEFHE
ncbi:NERD domain-containing protein [Alkalihalobacillus pseudalcaliphilus]|uniref:NERD domain-containing protein n=1 Tax=Alkalihalobacillus pseudalcaliphilus TaxID=79884 RepID=UPI00064DA02F|nr:NERD domain-containing protein [Alkalihalobacillus pseudalcaliphilus]KMK77794.1 hypothetical protein AB990_04930 [Alkalihalobacillus pseudalcaliphilus]